MDCGDESADEPMRSACLLPCFTKRPVVGQGLQLLDGRFWFCCESLRLGSFQGTDVATREMIN